VTPETKNPDLAKNESTSVATKAVAGFALFSLFFWRGRKTLAAPVKIRKSAQSVARAENQTGRLEKA
jgi:hypothetical protein